MEERARIFRHTKMEKDVLTKNKYKMVYFSAKNANKRRRQCKMKVETNKKLSK